MGTATILNDIQLIQYPMFRKHNLHFPSKETRVGNLQLVYHPENAR